MEKCINCGSELSWGGRAFNQEICWDCVLTTLNIKKEYGDILKHSALIRAECFDINCSI